jgi:hypothetical protein
MIAQVSGMVQIDSADPSAQGNYTCVYIEESVKNVCVRTEIQAKYLHFESKTTDKPIITTKDNKEIKDDKENKFNSSINLRISHEFISLMLCLFSILKTYGSIL